MNLQSQTMDAMLALYPVYPPQWITPVQPPASADGGIPLSAFTPQGLEVVIEPVAGLKSHIVAVYDVVTLYVNGVRTNASKTIMPGEENNRFLMYLPELWFTNGVNDVYYQVTRPSGNIEDSPTLQLLYNTPAPTVSVSHPPSISPGQPALITLTVGYARAYDTVTLTIGTWRTTFTNPDHTRPITYTLTSADLQQIGDGTHPVSARVVDQLTNTGVSATSTIDITANRPVLNSPIIVEADANKVLDVTLLGNKNPTIHALLWTLIEAGQQVWMTLTGQKTDGSAHNLVIWRGGSHQVNATWVSQGFWPNSPANSWFKELGDGSTLTIKFKASLDKSNNEATAEVFPDQNYTIRAFENVILSENFDTHPTVILTVGQSITLASMKISFLSGDGMMGITPLSSILPTHGGPFAPIAGKSSGQVLHMHIDASGSTQLMNMDFNWGYSSVSFWCRHAQIDNLRATFFDENKQVVQQVTIPPIAGPQQITGTSTKNNIWSMQVSTLAMDLIGLDFFTMQRI